MCNEVWLARCVMVGMVGNATAKSKQRVVQILKIWWRVVENIKTFKMQCGGAGIESGAASGPAAHRRSRRVSTRYTITFIYIHHLPLCSQGVMKPTYIYTPLPLPCTVTTSPHYIAPSCSKEGKHTITRYTITTLPQYHITSSPPCSKGGKHTVSHQTPPCPIMVWVHSSTPLVHSGGSNRDLGCVLHTSTLRSRY